MSFFSFATVGAMALVSGFCFFSIQAIEIGFFRTIFPESPAKQSNKNSGNCYKKNAQTIGVFAKTGSSWCLIVFVMILMIHAEEFSAKKLN